jgi:signal transduction histidine kinase
MLKNMTIRTQLTVSLAAIGAFFVVMTLINFNNNAQTTESFEKIRKETAPTLVLLSKIEALGLKMIVEAEGISIYIQEIRNPDEGTVGEEEEDEELASEQAELSNTLESFEAAVIQYMAIAEGRGEEDEETLGESIRDAGRQLHAVGTALVELRRAGASGEEVIEALEDIEAAEDLFQELVAEAIAIESEEFAKADETVDDNVAYARNIGIGLMVITLLLLAFILWGVLSFLVRPLRHLQSAAEAIGAGDLTKRAEVQSQNELGSMAAAFNTMAEQLTQRIVDAELARAQAERSDQVKSAFLASMSHELRTPLNAVINFTKFVAKGDLGPVNERQEETLNEVISSGRHLLNLINDVLDMSKIESGSLRLFVDDNVDLNALLDSVISTGKGLLADKSVELRTEIDPDLPHIRGDRQRILQILLNVISNACKFTDDGYIKIRASQSAGEIVITVEDTGPGIAPEDQAAVFEPFKQTSSGLRKGSGTGLGMPISRSLAEAHGGRLWVDSEVGKGSNFCIALPIRAKHLTPTLTTQGAKV